MSNIEIDRRKLRERLGRIDQLASLREVVLAEGRGRGVRLIEVHNGSGLEFTVMADRCLDIYDARFKGVPLAWLTPNGIVNPACYEPEGARWLRSWPGGLLTTAGFLNVGGPDEASGDCQGLHGRASHLAAEQLKLDSSWGDDDTFTLSVAGTVRHTMAFGEKIELRRTIRTFLGRNEIELCDRVENQSHAPTPLMMLYHCNFGYPLIDAETVLEARTHEVEPQTETAKGGLREWAKLQAPTAGYAEQVFYHPIPAEADGFARMALYNPTLGLRVTMAYRTAELPWLVEWKQMGQDEYVVGLEPGNCVPIGQSGNARRGSLATLAPGEIREFAVKITVAD